MARRRDRAAIDAQALAPRLMDPRRTHLGLMARAAHLAPDDYWVRHSYVQTLLLEVWMLSDRVARLDTAGPSPPPDALADSYEHLARSQVDLGRYCCAARSCLRGLELAPDRHDLARLLAQSLRLDGRFTAAEAVLRGLLGRAPHDGATVAELALVLLVLGRPDEAETCAREAARLAPGLARPWTVLGRLAFLRGREEEARACLQEAVSRGESAAFASYLQSTHELAQGDYVAGWRGYRRRAIVFTRHFVGFPWDQPLWDGGRLDGRTLLVQGEQGFGDMIQFVRFLPAVKASGARVLLSCPSVLANLLRRCEGADAVVHSGHAPRGAFDVHVPLASLPSTLGVELGGVAPRIPYLHADEARTAAWAARLPSGSPRIGIAWASLPTFIYARQKSIDLDALAPLLEMRGPAWISLQVSSGPRPSHPALHDRTDELVDFDETAALVASLDLVITVDTAVAHLAGALGRPTWLLLMHDADWRWLRDRDDSPWYPTMRLFRQSTPGRWSDVVARVVSALARQVGA